MPPQRDRFVRCPWRLRSKSSFINWYIEEALQRTGVAMETNQIMLVTSGKKKETLGVRLRQQSRRAVHRAPSPLVRTASVSRFLVHFSPSHTYLHTLLHPPSTRVKRPWRRFRFFSRS